MKSPIENPKLIYSVFIVFFLMNCWTWHKPYLFPSDKKKNLLFLGLIPIALSGSGNTSNTAETNVTVTGTVTNTNGTALGGHTLTFEPTGTTVTTDVSGNYTVSLPPGTYTVTVTDSTGAVIGTFTITVVTGGTTSVAVNTGSIIVTANGVTGQLDTVATPVFTPAAGTYKIRLLQFRLLQVGQLSIIRWIVQRQRRHPHSIQPRFLLREMELR